MPKIKTYQPIEATSLALTKIRALLLATVALPLAVAAVGTTTIALSSVTATEAHAYGWSDVKGAAKKVGGAVKKGAKKVGKKAGHVAKHGGKIAGGLAKDAAKGAYSAAKKVKKANDIINYVPRTIQKAARDGALKAVGKYGTGIVDGVAKTLDKVAPSKHGKHYDPELSKKVEGIISGAGDRFDRAVGKVKRKAGKIITGRNKIGSSYPSSIQQATRRQSTSNNMRKHQSRKGRDFNRRANSGTLLKTGVVKNGRFIDPRQRSVPRVSNRKSVARRIVSNKLRPGLVRDRRFRGAKQRKTIGRDRSSFGRPIYRKNRKVRKVTGITKDNLRPRKSIKQRKLIGRNRSSFGRPAVRKGNRKSLKTNVTRKRNAGLRNRMQRDRRSDFNRMRRSGRKAFRINNNRNNRLNGRSFKRRSNGRRG